MIPDRVRQAQRVLIIGGARSGKSTLAERILADEPTVVYVATSDADALDPDWIARLEAHRSRRPARWNTIETTDLTELLAVDGPPLLIDCLTLWLTQQMDRHNAWSEDAWPESGQLLRTNVTELTDSLRRTQRRVVIVSNEVGQGVVPAAASVRRFRDEMGWANQQVATACAEVVWAAAGRFTLMEEWM